MILMHIWVCVCVPYSILIDGFDKLSTKEHHINFGIKNDRAYIKRHMCTQMTKSSRLFGSRKLVYT